MRSKKTPFDQLHQLSKDLYTWASIQHLLDWDQETYMPAAAIEFRAEQTALLAEKVHQQKTSKKFGHLIQQASLDSTLTPAQRAAVCQWERDYTLATKLPTSFVKKFVTTTTNACHVWAQARKSSNFSLFAPHLDKIIQQNRKKAELLNNHHHPYDALLDLYEVGMTTDRLIPLFDRLKTALVTLLKKIQKKPPLERGFLEQEFSPEVQLKFGKKLLKIVGFAPQNSRLDLTTHPFCSNIHPLDTRMTTRIHSHDLMSNLFSVLHEGGHGMYNQQLPLAWWGTPLCESMSLGIDESQSRWWETRIGRSLPFWTHLLPLLKKDFPQLHPISLETFYSAINTIRPSLIRVEADEVTYNLHIILRFEIEKALIEGSLKTREIPEVWNQKMQELLGITPPSDAQGCLQDIHWSLGSFGYFPTYALGNLYASQFFATFEQTHPDWGKRVSHGEFEFIRNWLSSHIHQWGRQYTPDELIERLTGKTLDESAYIGYLEKKYSKIYGF